jgi:short-subunit dehydrogenase
MAYSSQGCALITGASGGIGKATALAFAKAGFSLILPGRSISVLDTIAQEVRALGSTATVLSLDLSNLEQVSERMQAITQEHPIDVLVNAAGMGYTAPLADTSLADWQQVLNLNLTSVLQCIQGVLPSMRIRKRGTIINIVSIAGHQVFPEWGAYCVSKFGLMALSKTLAMEERTYGIRVVALCPGAVNTPLWDTETVHADFDRTAMLTPDIVAQSILHTALLPPQAVIEELTLMPLAGTL